MKIRECSNAPTNERCSALVQPALEGAAQDPSRETVDTDRQESGKSWDGREIDAGAPPRAPRRETANTGSKRTVCVVLDTNVFVYETSLLRTALGAALAHSLLRLDGVLGLPEVVEEEVVKQAAKVGREALAKVREGFSTLSKLTGSITEYLDLVPMEGELEERARERLRELDTLLKRVPFAFEHAKSALRRVNDETPPNGPNRQQFKDSAIWEALLDLSRTHTVHFVTQDKAFFEQRDPKKGLACNLARDCEDAEGGVFVHYGLRSCLKALEGDMPPLDPRALAAAADRAVIGNLRDIAVDKGFGLYELKDSNISAFLTEKTNVLAVSFELIYRADFPLSEGDERVDAELTITGDCYVDVREESASDVRLDRVILLPPDGDPIEGRWMGYAYVSGISGGFRRRRPYELRIPLDPEDLGSSIRAVADHDR